MGSRARLAVVCVSLASTLSGWPALAENDGAWSTQWREGLRVESPDGRFRLTFGGRVQADFTFGLSEQDGWTDQFGEFDDRSQIRRGRLFVSGVVYDRVEFKIQYDFSSGDAVADDVYLGFLDTAAGDIRIGHFKEPFSLETLTSSKYVPFVERSLPVVFAPGRNIGLMLHDSHGDRLNWAAGAFRESDEFSVSSGEDLLNLTGRIVYRPIYRHDGERLLHLGLSATSKDTDGTSSRLRARPEVRTPFRALDTDEFLSDGQDALGAEVAGVFGPLWLTGELMLVEVQTPDHGDLSFDGFYLQAGYFLTGEHRGYKTSSGVFDRTRPRDSWDGDGGPGAWEVAARYSETDLSDGPVAGGDLQSLSFALNWYPNPVTKLMLNYVSPDRDGTGGADFLAVRAQIDF